MKLLRDQDVAPRVALVPPPAAAPGASLDAPQGDDGGVRTLGLPRARRIAVMALACLALGALAVRWARNTPGFAVRRVVIEGSVHSQADALARSTGAVGVNGFRVDLESVRRAVLADPWIADARVRRVLPHELRVTVVERVPVAVSEDGSERALVDAEGRVLEEGLEPGRFPLPAITGLQEVAPEKRSARMAHAAASLGAIRAASPRLFRIIRSVDASSVERLTIITDSLPPIWIEGPDSADEVAGYACRVDTVRRAIGDVEYVDARWSDRLFLMPLARDRSNQG